APRPHGPLRRPPARRARCAARPSRTAAQVLRQLRDALLARRIVDEHALALLVAGVEADAARQRAVFVARLCTALLKRLALLRGARFACHLPALEVGFLAGEVIARCAYRSRDRRARLDRDLLSAGTRLVGVLPHAAPRDELATLRL